MNRPSPDRAEPAAPTPRKPDPPLTAQQHSGEGSASALESLRKLEDSRKPPERPRGEGAADSPGDRAD